MPQYDVIIVGGGLAGLTAAIDISQKGHAVLVIEKQRYPHHKVCGEYVSNEVLDYLEHLGVSLAAHQAVAISRLTLSTANGKSMTAELPLGGTGISRYAFDNLLYLRGQGTGAIFEFQNVISIRYSDETFHVTTDDGTLFTATIVIGAYGKRSALDKDLNRDFALQKSSWLAVKSHYEFRDFQECEVGLHNFRGGYAGLSKTETGAVNFCYLASYESFRQEKDIEGFNAHVVAANPHLGAFLSKAKPLFDRPKTIAQVSFHPKKAVENHILMCGDTAGLIHPLCGNGMAMAIHSAKIASDLVHEFLVSKTRDRAELEREYRTQWQKQFKRRLWMGRRLQALLLNPKVAAMAMSALITQPWLLQKLIQSTHGKPI